MAALRFRKRCLNRYQWRREHSQNFVFPGNAFNSFPPQIWAELWNYTNANPLTTANTNNNWTVVPTAWHTNPAIVIDNLNNGLDVWSFHTATFPNITQASATGYAQINVAKPWALEVNFQNLTPGTTTLGDTGNVFQMGINFGGLNNQSFIVSNDTTNGVQIQIVGSNGTVRSTFNRGVVGLYSKKVRMLVVGKTQTMYEGGLVLGSFTDNAVTPTTNTVVWQTSFVLAGGADTVGGIMQAIRAYNG